MAVVNQEEHERMERMRAEQNRRMFKQMLEEDGCLVLEPGETPQEPVEVQDNLIYFTDRFYSWMYKLDPSGDALRVWMHYVWTARRQRTNRVWCTTKYLMAGLSMSEKRVKTAKGCLKKAGVVEYHAWREGQRIKKWFVKINMNIALAASTGAFSTGSNSNTVENGPIEVLEGNKKKVLEESKETSMSADADDAFDRLWKNRASGHKRDTNRGKALLHYKRRLKDGFSPEQVQGAYDAYVGMCKRERRAEQYIKQMQFFLSDRANIEGWLDIDDEEGGEQEPMKVDCPECGREVVVDRRQAGLQECSGCGLLLRDFKDHPSYREPVGVK